MLVLFVKYDTAYRTISDQLDLGRIRKECPDSVVFVVYGDCASNEMIDWRGRMKGGEETENIENVYVIRTIDSVDKGMQMIFFAYTKFKTQIDAVLARGDSTECNTRKDDTVKFLFLDSACVLGERFGTKMLRLNDVRLSGNQAEWVFAHTHGFFDIGICNEKFLNDFGSEIAESVANRTSIPSLFAKSICTLKTTHTPTSCDKISCGFETDSFSVTGVKFRNKNLFFVYISSLGIYRFYESDESFVFPVWAAKCHEVACEQDMHNIAEILAHLGLSSVWIPLVPFRTTV